MPSERWRQIEDLFNAALEREPAARKDFLRQACRGDESLLHAVESLLVHDAKGGELLSQPIDKVADELLPGDPAGLHFSPGSMAGGYRITERLGAGGMGEVYLARDTRLGRLVAIKVVRHERIPPQEGRLRFLQEARAASALNHSNIVQIYELASQDGHDFIVMEYVTGQPLAQLLREKQLSVTEALDYATQIASALAAAHAAGIVHRDMKPGNIMVTAAGLVKILDFGLAKRESNAAAGDSATVTAVPETAAGTVLGTAAYMSPEQAEGKLVDARSDIFSTGAVFYEMLTGTRAFGGESIPGVLTKVLRDAPRSIREIRPDVPESAARIVGRCLEKDPALRYAGGEDLVRDLVACRQPARAVAFTAPVRVLTVAILIAAIGLAGWFYNRSRHARWTRNEALPQIRKLIAKSDYIAAFALTRMALSYVPDDPQLKQQWSEVSYPVTLNTTPPGAKLSYRPYGDARAPWQLVGQTPFKAVVMPNSYMQLRVEKAGFEPAEFATVAPLLDGRNIPLLRAGQVPAGMVAVSSPAPWMLPDNVMPLPEYFLDRFEVTNRQFQQFLEAGGYRDPKYWRIPFRKDGHEIPFQEAIAFFRDATGRPGAAGWNLGAFPKDRADIPVSGVSGYEAAAYCEYAGKTLPTANHWRKAAGFTIMADILLFSNFSGAGPARGGANTGISAFGAYDMAGNVKEWCRTNAGEKWAILGGGWNEPSYMFLDPDAQDPFTRGTSYGFRCAQYPTEPPPAAFAPMERTFRDYSIEKPVRDDAFEIFHRMYTYDKIPLDVKTESVDDSNEDFRKEKVSYRAAYGDERIPAYLYLPKNAKPPYQTVLWVPGAYAWALRNSESTAARAEFFTFLPRTGRAVLCPIYKGTYERHVDATGPNAFRDSTIQWAKDVSRSVDFLESRPDIQSSRLAYYGLSMGATFGPIFLALESRLKTGILVSGGLFGDKISPEIDVFNFAPRVRVPVLMLNGRNDFYIPAATLQKPMFQWLGTAERDKQYLLFETGHMPPLQDIMREALNWLDRYLGPVTNR